MNSELTPDAGNNLAKAVGSVILNFAYLEIMLSYSIWVMIDISDPDIGKIVTAGTSFNTLIGLFDALYRHRVLDVIEKEGITADRQLSTLDNLIKRMTKANERRNMIVHSAWAIDTKKPDVYSRFKFTAKRSKGLRRVDERITVDDVHAAAHFISEVANELQKFSQPFHSPIFWLTHWQTWVAQWEEWERSGDLDKWIEWARHLPDPPSLPGTHDDRDR
jgi:hypothetical protein